MSNSDLCVNIKSIKPGFKASAKAMHPNKKGAICASAHKDISSEDFADWVNLVRSPLPPKRPIFRELDAPGNKTKTPPKKERPRKVFYKL